MDLNGDGSLDEREGENLAVGCPNPPICATERSFFNAGMKRFNVLDENRDGLLTSDEAKMGDAME